MNEELRDTETSQISNYRKWWNVLLTLSLDSARDFWLDLGVDHFMDDDLQQAAANFVRTQRDSLESLSPDELQKSIDQFLKRISSEKGAEVAEQLRNWADETWEGRTELYPWEHLFRIWSGEWNTSERVVATLRRDRGIELTNWVRSELGGKEIFSKLDSVGPLSPTDSDLTSTYDQESSPLDLVESFIGQKKARNVWNRILQTWSTDDIARLISWAKEQGSRSNISPVLPPGFVRRHLGIGG